MRYFAIVPAAGIGSRMNKQIPKQYLKIAGLTILEHCLNKLASVTLINQIVVAINPNDQHFNKIKLPNNTNAVIGGNKRQTSVLNALQYLTNIAADDDWILVHDAARPLIKITDINILIEQLKYNSVGGILAAVTTDTLKQASQNQQIKSTINRQQIWRAFTPQMFRFKILLKALATTTQTVTDEAEAMELAGYQPKLINGDVSNIKITTPADLEFAEWQLTTLANR